ncbi:MAG: helix-turn-helix transcriptional regulator [Phycisphaerales bacterium]|nr:helix-turn-helix transcriptional regulator [Hyphomonadaceae bacterium]
MARIVSLWRSPEIDVYRFDHPVEHEDQAYEEVAGAFRASFVEEGTFDLHIGESRWRVAAGDVMLSYPGMRFRAGFQGKGFNDTCLSVTYLASRQDGFDPEQRWAKSGRPVLPASNRLRYLRWGLRRAIESSAPMFAEYCATEIFRSDSGGKPAPLFSERKFCWYAERVHHVRERIDAEYADAMTVSELARGVGMSMFHFTRVFIELMGVPPHRYLLETRLKAARAMLRQGRSVTETCFACGFNNLSHFSRSFARRYGEAPSRLFA